MTVVERMKQSAVNAAAGYQFGEGIGRIIAGMILVIGVTVAVGLTGLALGFAWLVLKWLAGLVAA